EPGGLIDRVQPTAVDVTGIKSGTLQPPPRERVEVDPPVVRPGAGECATGAPVLRDEAVVDIDPDLVTRGPRRRAQPCQQPLRRGPHRSNRGFEHTGRQPAPARMRSA